MKLVVMSFEELKKCLQKETKAEFLRLMEQHAIETEKREFDVRQFARTPLQQV